MNREYEQWVSAKTDTPVTFLFVCLSSVCLTLGFFLLLESSFTSLVRLENMRLLALPFLFFFPLFFSLFISSSISALHHINILLYPSFFSYTLVGVAVGFFALLPFRLSG